MWFDHVKFIPALKIMVLTVEIGWTENTLSLLLQGVSIQGHPPIHEWIFCVCFTLSLSVSFGSGI
jgi:hypothetical protein